jgi:multicomponent Na+:H+ antiporter subunit F
MREAVLRDIFLAAAIAEAAIAALLLIRVARGPSVSDRIVAVNVMSTQMTLGMLCFSAYADNTEYLDVTLWMAAFSYLATFVWARLVERELM